MYSTGTVVGLYIYVCRCILTDDGQIIDIVNVGAKEENRLDHTNNPHRTLKLCLTDGHQVIYGIEYVNLGHWIL